MFVPLLCVIKIILPAYLLLYSEGYFVIASSVLFVCKPRAAIGNVSQTFNSFLHSLHKSKPVVLSRVHLMEFVQESAPAEHISSFQFPSSRTSPYATFMFLDLPPLVFHIISPPIFTLVVFARVKVTKSLQ